MFQSYVTTALRNLWNNKLYTAINGFGLAIGLASCLLIILFVRHETGYDQFLPNLDRLFRFEAVANIPGRQAIDVSTYVGATKDLLPKDYAEIEQVLRIQVRQGSIIRDGETFTESFGYVDANFFDVFELPLVAGDADTALDEPSNIILSEEMARKYLGDGPYLGETILISDNYERSHKITGILRDIPNNSHLDLDFLLPIEPRVYDAAGDSATTDLNRWNGLPFYVYLKLREGASIAPIKATINDWVDRYFPAEISALVNIKGSELFTPRIIPVADIHLLSPAQDDMKSHGSVTTMFAFASIAFLILLIASINFMNLATARATLRSREVAVRKVMGANRKQLIAQFEGESLVLTFISLFLAISMTGLILPYFHDVTQIDLTLSYLAEPLVLGGTIMLTVVVGLVAGLHPALVLSGVRPARILAASGRSFPATSWLRSALVIMQFAISATMMIATAIIYLQTSHVQNMDFGYLKDNRMVVRGLGNPQIRDAADSFRERIGRLPGVTGVSLASFAPGDGSGRGLSLKVPGEDDRLIIFYNSVDWDFFDFFGVEPLAGRVFSREFQSDVLTGPADENDAEPHSGSAVINLMAMRRLGYASPDLALGQVFYRGENDQVAMTVVGVVPDVHFSSPRQEMAPELFLFEEGNFSTLNIRYRTEDPEALGLEIENIWKEMFPGLQVVRSYLEDNIARQFEFERIIGKLVAIFSGLAVLIACMGLFGLASFTVTRRTKEIGIRKVMGASSAKILRLLLRQMSVPVLIANIIAWPIAWFTMSEWIASFNYRIDLTGYFAAAAATAVAATLVIAWATIAGHAIRVARANPILALRYE